MKVIRVCGVYYAIERDIVGGFLGRGDTPLDAIKSCVHEMQRV